MAGLEFNVKDALNVLKMYADAGRDRKENIDLRLLLFGLYECLSLFLLNKL